ncbi:MAG TPA: hypothetical protein VGJ13_05300 [Pseudonocardiaceae bacterium]|jgi:hypothetical protein
MTMPTFTDGVVVHQASLNALSTGINNINSLLTGAVAPRAYVPTAAAYTNASHNVNSAADTIITFDAALTNNDNMWVASNSNFTVNTAGIYIIYGQVHFASNNTGSRAVHLLLNGTAVGNSVAAHNHPGMTTGDGVALTAISPPWSLSVGATIYMSVYQDSGGLLATTVTFSGTYMAAIRLGD